MIVVHELVYLSTTKVSQFAASRKKRLSGAGFEMRVSPLNLGEVAIQKSAAQQAPRFEPTRELEAALKALKRAKKSLTGHQDPQLQPGQWVHFTAPMNYLAITRGELSGSVIFLDFPSTGRFGYYGGGPGAHQSRLLLHGSSKHLLGGQESGQREFNGDVVSIVSASYPSTARWIHVLAAGLRETATDANNLTDLLNPTREFEPFDGCAESLLAVTAVLDESFGTITAAWMGGMARVTAAAPPEVWNGMEPGYWQNPPRVVAATPLFVEFVNPPS